MPITGKWIFTAAMDVDPDKESLFNEVYDTEHVPYLKKVPGVISITRARLDTQGKPRYASIVELESPDVLTSPAWAKAVEEGRWPTHVRPFTTNRHHTLHKVMK
jgi:hypothetical protein